MESSTIASTLCRHISSSLARHRSWPADVSGGPSAKAAAPRHAGRTTLTPGLRASALVRMTRSQPDRDAGPMPGRWSPDGDSAGAAGQQHVRVETGAVAGVAGAAGLVDLDQDGVAVAVERDRPHELDMTRGLALDPVLPPAAGPVGAAAGRQRAPQRLVVHPAEHQHLAGVELLRDRREQPGRVPLQPGRDPRVKVPFRRHARESPTFACTGPAMRTGHPAALSASLTSPIRSSPKWNRLAASTASAPARTAGAKSAACPAPPLAITGTSTTARTAVISGRSNPALVPSASIEFSRISPAPSSAALAAHRTASSPVPRRPPCVVTSKPLRGPGARRASTDSTTHWEPNLMAASASSSGRSMAAVFSDTLS